MTSVNSMNGTKLLVLVDMDGDNNFVASCLINAERGIQFSSDTNDVVIPDCDNPDDPGWKEVFKDGLSATISGAGLLHTTAVEAWFDWFAGAATKSCRVRIDVTAIKGGGYWRGDFHLTQFEVTGNRNEKAQNSVTLVSSGIVTWTNAT